MGNFHDYVVLYEEAMYQASSWHKPRKVIIKAEKPSGQIAINHMFLVTNMHLPCKDVVAYYANRRTMENFTKEGKRVFNFDGTTSSSFMAKP